MNVRVVCAHILSTVLRHEASLNTALPNWADKVPERDLNLLQELCYGTLRHLPALETIAEKLVTKPLKKKDADVHALILSGLYQIREMRTPPHAAVNESVSACKSLKKNWARGLVNSVLRRYLRERTQIDDDCRKDDRYQTLHPRWLQERLIRAWGDDARNIMAANNQRPPMTLRINQRKTTRLDYLKLLEEKQLSAQPAPYSPTAIYLGAPCNVDQLPGFDDGWVSVQDEAAQLCCELLATAPGQRVLDSCCAPGGKTCHILEHQPDLESMVALDVDEERLAMVRQNLQRLQLSATLTAADATDRELWWDGIGFDRILLDAPCSATGVIRRHPDIKVLRREEDIGKLAATQLRLLETLWTTLKNDGTLLYATCSVLPEENDDVVEAFVNTQPDCQPTAIDTNWGIATRLGRQLFPTPGGHDGFYYALLTKQITATGNNTP